MVYAPNLFESDCHFCNFAGSGWFIKLTVLKQNSKQPLHKVSFHKVTAQMSIAELLADISNEMIKYYCIKIVITSLAYTFNGKLFTN